MELALDFECFAGRILVASPQALYRATALPLPERARVLKLALTILQRHLVSRHVFQGGVLTKWAVLVPLGGPLVVGLSARPYFTRQTEMIHLLHHLRRYCEEHWARKPVAQWPPSPFTR